MDKKRPKSYYNLQHSRGCEVKDLPQPKKGRPSGRPTRKGKHQEKVYIFCLLCVVVKSLENYHVQS